MFDHLVFTFYWVDSIENFEYFFSHNQESKLNAGNFLIIFSVMLSVDYDL